MLLNAAIQKIVNSFSKDDLFDSHTIINEIVRNPEFHEFYLKDFPENCSVNQYHGQIAKMIGNLPNIQSFGKKIKSHTIYGDITENELWQKMD